MAELNIYNVIFCTDDDRGEDGSGFIRLSYCDSGAEKKDTDLIIERDFKFDNGEINTQRIYIQGIDNILALKMYVDHVINLHDRDLVP